LTGWSGGLRRVPRSVARPCSNRDLARRSGRGRRRRILRRMTKPAAPKRHLPTSPFKAPVAPAPKHFAVGDQVTHDMYGLGRVIGVEDGIAVLVDFGSSQMRILSPYSKMTKL
jgi:hypothetical protein